MGLGSLLTVIFQWWLARSDKRTALRFDERKAAYIGLWQAMHRSKVEHTEEAALHVGHWGARCELVAPAAVRNAVRQLIATKPCAPERNAAVKAVLDEMRRDLGVAD